MLNDKKWSVKHISEKGTDDRLNQLIEILTQRLERKGIALDHIPGFIRNLAHIVSLTPDMNLREVNRRLHLVGWNDFDLDDHTFQLVIASLEAGSVIGFEHNPARRLDSTFKAGAIPISTKH